MLTKLVGPDWNNRLVTEITSYDVEKLLNRIAEGRCRPHKTKPNNRARKLLGHSQTQTTQRYAHLIDSPLRAGVDAVASAFQPKPVSVHDVGDQLRKSA